MIATKNFRATSLHDPVTPLEDTMGHLRGSVVATNGKPIAECSIVLQETDYVTRSDKNGIFVLANIKPARYTFMVKRQGYYRYVLPDVRITAGDNTGFQFVMLPLTPIGAY